MLGGIDQNNVLTTIRNAEVLGDPTTALALECWRRRRDQSRGGSGEAVRLCCSQRLVRLQPFDEPGYTPHFRLFALVSAGRDTGSHAFEIQNLGEHIRFYLRLFAALNEQGFSFREPLVEISDTAVVEALCASPGSASKNCGRPFARMSWADRSDSWPTAASGCRRRSRIRRGNYRMGTSIFDWRA